MQTRIFQEKLFRSLKQFAKSAAVEYGNKVITYAELDEKSDRVARWIWERGIKTGTFIGILTEDRLDLIIMLTGIMKAGCVIVPLHTGYPGKRLEAMIRATDLGYIFCDEPDVRRFANFETAGEKKPEFILYRDIAKKQEPGHSGALEYGDISYDPEAPLYIHFTSGTTGVPKAILGKNKSLRQFLEWEIDTFAINSEYRVAQLTVPGFDPLLRDVFTALFSGGTVCIPGEQNIVLSADGLKEWVDRQGIVLIHCIAGQFRLLSSRPLHAGLFKALKYIVMAGEKINPSDLTHWYETFGERIGLANCYGTSETTMFKTCYMIRESDVDRDRIPVGKPIRGSRIIILDKGMNVCDESEPGEIYIRTPYMSCGYYKEPLLNEKSFIPNPFSDNPADLLHKTGDRGLFLPDGNIDYLGRLDRQLKIRGNRIEPGEIESILTRYPGIEEAVVTKKEAGKSELLAAYIVESGSKAESETPSSTLEEFLKERLPAYMIPTNIIKLKEIPRNAHRKIDYSALPDPLKQDEESDFTAPRDETERLLAKIWSDILGIEKIGINSNFFKTGGNSLNLMTLTYRIHKVFDVRLSLADIFENATISQQAELVGGVGCTEFTGIRPAARKSFYVLSAAQERMYILNSLDRESTNYNLPMVTMLTGRIHIERVEKTFKKMIDRHESLRTGFEQVEGSPVQRVYDAHEIDFEIEYYEGNENRNAFGGAKGPGPSSIAALIDRMIRPFDLRQAPLLRAGLIFLEEDRHIMVVDMHHIISDGTSLGVFRREFTAYYAGEEPPPLRIHYKDYAEWQNSAEQKEKMRLQESYWHDQFKGGVPVLDLPYDYPRPAHKSDEGNIIFFELDGQETAALNRMALEQETTLYTALLTIYYIFLSKLGGSEDITVGTPTAGRLHADMESITGMFVNTLCLRNYPRKEKGFRDFLQEVKKRTLAAFENQDYQFEELVERFDPVHDMSRSPLFDVMFSLQNMELGDIQVPGLKLSHYEHEKKTAKFDLMLTGFEVEDRLRLSFEYSTKLFKQETIERFIRYFKDITAAVQGNINIELQGINIAGHLKAPESAADREIDGNFRF